MILTKTFSLRASRYSIAVIHNGKTLALMTDFKRAHDYAKLYNYKTRALLKIVR